jgi:hypothetical protein
MGVGVGGLLLRFHFDGRKRGEGLIKLASAQLKQQKMKSFCFPLVKRMLQQSQNKTYWMLLLLLLLSDVVAVFLWL